jgi:hypothetical protein
MSLNLNTRKLDTLGWAVKPELLLVADTAQEITEGLTRSAEVSMSQLADFWGIEFELEVENWKYLLGYATSPEISYELFGDINFAQLFQVQLHVHADIALETTEKIINLPPIRKRLAVDVVMSGAEADYYGFVCTRESVPLLDIFAVVRFASERSSKSIGAFLLLIDNADVSLLVLEFLDFEMATSVVGRASLKLRTIPSNVEPSAAKDVPFPQANSAEKLVLLIEYLAESPLSVSQVADRLEFSYRQALYYLNALAFLNIASRSIQDKSSWALFPSVVVELRHSSAGKLLAAKMKETAAISGYMAALVDNGANAVHVPVLENQPDLSGVTLARRAQTLSAWSNWLLGQNNDKVGNR